MADKDRDIEDSEEPGVVPSRLDEATHSEAMVLFQDSANSIFFSKAQQWKPVGATLVTFLAIIALGKYVSSVESFILNLKLVVILAATAAIFILGIYQFWQHTESK
ncbi:MAG: hypothetical protein O3A84_02820, partial [Proteobacteria bacterium]|nr:hypothetical protein [Pseudomonadota bacterium]